MRSGAHAPLPDHVGFDNDSFGPIAMLDVLEQVSEDVGAAGAYENG